MMVHGLNGLVYVFYFINFTWFFDDMTGILQKRRLPSDNQLEIIVDNWTECVHFVATFYQYHWLIKCILMVLNFYQHFTCQSTEIWKTDGLLFHHMFAYHYSQNKWRNLSSFCIVYFAFLTLSIVQKTNHLLLQCILNEIKCRNSLKKLTVVTFWKH